MVEMIDKKPNPAEMEQVGKAIAKLFGKEALNPPTTWDKLLSDFAKNARITYGDQSNFTYCLVKYKNRQFIGITKRNPIDEPNDIRAWMIAVYRAAEDMAVYFCDK
jgi:hypothetical protein